MDELLTENLPENIVIYCHGGIMKVFWKVLADRFRVKSAIENFSERLTKNRRKNTGMDHYRLNTDDKFVEVLNIGD